MSEIENSKTPSSKKRSARSKEKRKKYREESQLAPSYEVYGDSKINIQLQI